MNNKALILSQTLHEATTDVICKWLMYYDVKYDRLNGENILQIENLSKLPKNNSIKIVWYRRKLSKNFTSYKLIEEDQDTKRIIDNFINQEFNTLHSFLFYRYDISKWINNPLTDFCLNKLDVLYKAKSIGLSVPYTDIITSKSEMRKILIAKKSLIVKPISECVFINYLGEEYKMLTKVIDTNNLVDVPDKFFPSLVQENINKKFEIRTFYLYGSFYSMAIFSQQNVKTKADFRNYDPANPNRTVPYQLPKNIEEKLEKLMKIYQFNTGSIDLMYDEKENFIFLEINPDGQFGMVSYPCNYYLEKEMANKIKEHVEE